MRYLLERAAFAGALLLAASAIAQPVDRAVTRDLDGGAAFSSMIYDGVVMRIQAMEHSRRSLLVQRCTALDRDFPRHPAPRMTAVTDAVWRWSVQGGVPGVADNKHRALTLAIIPALIGAAYTPQQLAQWDAFRATEQGRRGIAVAAMQSAILRVEDALVDVNSGVAWAWPLAQLRDLADRQGLRAPLDQAVDEVLPGASRILAGFSTTPGASDPGDLAERFGANTERVADAFIRHLAPADAAALQALDKQPVYQRWPELLDALLVFVSADILAPPKSGERALRMSAAEFCRANELARCDAAFESALERYRTESVAYAESDQFQKTVRQIVKQLPEAGCP
jgi:hypothetical protein